MAACIEEVKRSYCQALFESDEARASAVISAALGAGSDPESLLLQVVIPGIDHMGESLIENQEINLAQHFFSAKISESMTSLLLGHFVPSGPCPGCVVIGNAMGDYHGLGKKIVSSCLRSHLFKVVDAGLHVAPERFIDLAVENDAQIIGVSAMMAHTATGPNGALGVRKLLRQRGLEKRIKLMVGGAPYRFDPELYLHVGADGWAENGIEAVKLARTLAQEADHG